MEVSENDSKGCRHIEPRKKHIRDLKISGGIGGRQSTEGLYWKTVLCAYIKFIKEPKSLLTQAILTVGTGWLQLQI